MLNITLTITAAPELLSALNNMPKAFEGVSVNQSTFNMKECQGNGPSTDPIIPQAPINPVAAPTTIQPIQVPMQNPVQPVPIQATPAVQTLAPNPVQPVPIPERVPTTTQSYTMEQLAVAATQLVDAGRRNELVNLLSSFGVQALTALPKEQYGAFATQLRTMGAKL